jgi:hypothetical protein
MENQNQIDEDIQMLFEYKQKKDALSYLNLLIINCYRNKKFIEIKRTEIGYIFKCIIYSPFWKDTEKLKECLNLIITNECIYRKMLIRRLLEIENDHHHYCFSDFENIMRDINNQFRYIYFIKTIKDTLNVYNNHIKNCKGRYEMFGKMKYYIFNILYI